MGITVKVILKHMYNVLKRLNKEISQVKFSIQLKIHSIDYRGSIVDGPGVRTVLFVQGCEQHCEGCHNYGTWDPNLGKFVEIDQLASELREKCQNKKITISGGEPLLQYPAILELVNKLHDFDIALYTGFEYADVPKEILPSLQYIKVGKYIKEKQTTITEYIGSTNQKFITLRGN